MHGVAVSGRQNVVALTERIAAGRAGNLEQVPVLSAAASP